MTCRLLARFLPTTQKPPVKITFCMITMYFHDDTTSEHIISSDEVERFSEACMRLHSYPGINPHNGGLPKKIKRITRKDLLSQHDDMLPGGPYWWSTPDLKNNHDPAGAKVWTFNDDLPESYGQEIDIWNSSPGPIPVPVNPK